MVKSVEIHKMQPKPMEIQGIGCVSGMCVITYGKMISSTVDDEFETIDRIVSVAL